MSLVHSMYPELKCSIINNPIHLQTRHQIFMNQFSLLLAFFFHPDIINTGGVSGLGQETSVLDWLVLVFHLDYGLKILNLWFPLSKSYQV